MTAATQIRDGVVWWVVKASSQIIVGSGYDREAAEAWVREEGRVNVEYELYRVTTKDGKSTTKKIDSLNRSA
jgi:hypothetical protein